MTVVSTVQISFLLSKLKVNRDRMVDHCHFNI